MLYNPIEDGYRHLNIYSKGHTQLGRDLSHFSDFSLLHPEYGEFASMEGYWQWLATGQKEEAFKTLVGFEAKEKAKTLERVFDKDFQKKVCQGLLCRFDTHPDLKRRFIENTLPLTHYYYYGDDPYNAKVVVPESSEFVLQYLKALCPLLRKEERAVEIHTVQLSKKALAKQRNVPVLDITVKSGDATFAPSWGMVKAVKAGAIRKEVYEKQYYEMMRESWKVNNDRWLEVLNGGRVALACYCRAGEFCHRHLLKKILFTIAEKKNRPIVDAGEIT